MASSIKTILAFSLLLSIALNVEARGGFRGGGRGGSRGGSRGSSISRGSSSSGSRYHAPIRSKISSSGISRVTSRLPKVPSLGRRLTPSEKYVAIAGASWVVSQRLRRTSRYVNYRCRYQFSQCGDVTSYNTECDYVTTRKSCLQQGGHCSDTEWRWMEAASCDANSSTLADFPNSTWPANQVLKLSVSMSSAACQREFLQCVHRYTGSKEVDSYCTLLEDRKACFTASSSAGSGCTQAEWQVMSDAACTRSVINWQDDSLPESTALRLTAVLTSPQCQESFESCRDGAVSKSNDVVSSYCDLTESHGGCISANCSTSDFNNLRAAACSGSRGISSWSLAILDAFLVLIAMTAFHSS